MTSLDTPHHRDLLTQLQATLDAFRADNPYVSFDLWTGCGRDAVEDAYLDLVPKHHPDRFAHLRSDQVHHLANLIFIELSRLRADLLSREPSAAPTRPRPVPDTPALTQTLPPGASAPPSLTQTLPPGTTAAPSRSRTAPSIPTFTAAPPVSSQTAPSLPVFSPPPRSAVQVGGQAPAQAPTSRAAVIAAPNPTPRSLPVFQPPAKGASPAAAAPAPATPAPAAPSPAATAAANAGAQHFKEGLKHLKAEQFDAARATFAAAFNAQPDSGPYAAHLAWSEFLLSPDHPDVPARKLRLLAARPDAAESASFFLGKIAQHAKQDAEAIAHFNAVLKVNPKHVDAQRELRLLRLRAEAAASPADAPGLGARIGSFFKRLRGD